MKQWVTKLIGLIGKNDMKKTHELRVIDTPIYKYWQAFGLAFYSSSLYIDVIRRWRGLGFVYLLLLIMVTAIPITLRATIAFEQYFDEQIVLPFKLLPKFMIQNGEVIFDKPMPYQIKSKSGTVIGVVDTTGAVTRFNNKDPHSTISNN